MKINKVILNNFRQYHGTINIDLDTNTAKNIILVGGKNGFGKTNFLLSIVWCLYGDKIVQIDEGFKKEIQKETNYIKFMKQSLNRDSANNGVDKFSIEVFVDEIEKPKNLKMIGNSIIIKREYNVEKLEEHLFVQDSDCNDLFKEDEDKINFINDYLIPLEAAKFVFFDAEKIASWAELSTKDEGNVLNDALGKLLGLDIYENLKEDLKIYSDNLKKEGVNVNIKEQINNVEDAIKLNKRKIEDIDLKSALNENEIKELKQTIKEYQIFLNKNSKKETSTIDRETLYKEIENLTRNLEETERQFNELSELAPLAILGGKLEEVIEQLQLQEDNKVGSENNEETKRKLDNFIERLFNKPPEPIDGSMSFKNKVFYSDKAQGLINEIFELNTANSDLEFELDLTNADKELIYKASDLLKKQSKELFNSTISEFNSLQIQIKEKERLLKIIDSDLEDETVLEIISKKEETERSLEKLIADNGAHANQKDKLLKENIRLNQKYNALLQRSSGNKHLKNKIAVAKKYIDTLQMFIDNQKKSKKDSIAQNLKFELKKLMHKLQSEDSRFIEEAKVDILPDSKGLIVTVFDSDGKEIPKESFSTGEKQIYISCLIKSILKEAIQNYPVFIDTPLGRLDHEHIENILTGYYPELSEQVVLLATNNEITPRRFKNIESNVSKSYLINNEKGKSFFKLGYFKSYEN